MAFDGSGVFNRLFNWEADAAAEIDIMADRMDAEFNGIATGLSLCLTRTGQAGMLANLGMGNHKITSLLAGTVAGDAVNKTQLDANKSYFDVLIASGFDGSTPTVLGTLKSTKMPPILGNTLEIANTLPQFRITETDQVDPLGRFRFRGSSGGIWLERSTGAAWAADETIFTYFPNIFTIAVPVSLASTVQITGALTMLEDIKISNALPILWFHDSDAGSEPNWTLHSTNNTMRLGPADSSGIPRSDYNIYMDVTQTQIRSPTFRITSSAPRIWFEDVGGNEFILQTTDEYFRFYTASSGIAVDLLARLGLDGLWIPQGTYSGLHGIFSGNVTTGSLVSAGNAHGTLAHLTNRGYFLIGSYDDSIYGTGYARVYWQENIREMVIVAADGGATNLRITGTFDGDGSLITGILASQITRTAGAVGTYRWLLGPSGGHTAGTSYSGGSLSTPHITVNVASGNIDSDSYGSGPSGTWRAMQSGTAAAGQMALGYFLRIS